MLKSEGMFTKVSAHSQSADYTPGRALRFYVPLVLQAVSQSLTMKGIITIFPPLSAPASLR